MLNNITDKKTINRINKAAKVLNLKEEQALKALQNFNYEALIILSQLEDKIETGLKRCIDDLLVKSAVVKHKSHKELAKSNNSELKILAKIMTKR